ACSAGRVRRRLRRHRRGWLSPLVRSAISTRHEIRLLQEWLASSFNWKGKISLHNKQGIFRTKQGSLRWHQGSEVSEGSQDARRFKLPNLPEKRVETLQRRSAIS